MPNHNSQQSSSQDSCIHHQQAVDEQGGAYTAVLLRVRTGPEYPEDDLRELS